MIDGHGRRIIAYGTADEANGRKIDGDTVFEIGSATEVFTSLLLLLGIQRGEVEADYGVYAYLPPEYMYDYDGLTPFKAPEYGIARRIPLLALARHTSRLPRLPSNLEWKDGSNPYADYSVRQLYDFLSTDWFPDRAGPRDEHSIVDTGLLGHVLSLRAGMDYDTLFQTRVAKPLGIRSTGIALSSRMKRHLAIGHNDRGEPVPNWDIPTLAGAGALRSTANDLLTFLAEVLGYEGSPFSAMESELLVRRRVAHAGLEKTLGWYVSRSPGGREIVWHNGGTGGYRSFIGYDPSSHVGVVVLSNTSTADGVDDIGQHLLDPLAPLVEAPRPRKAIAIDTKVFDTYAGDYWQSTSVRAVPYPTRGVPYPMWKNDMEPDCVGDTPDATLHLSREGDRMFIQKSGQPAFEIAPQSEHAFFMKDVHAEITLVPGDSLLLRQNGVEMKAGWSTPIPYAQKPERLPQREIAVDPTVLERYAGRYLYSPNYALVVTHEGDRLVVQMPRQPRIPILPNGDRTFFAGVADAQITFETDSGGNATALTLQQYPGRSFMMPIGAPAYLGARARAVRAGVPGAEKRLEKPLMIDLVELEKYVGRYAFNSDRSIAVVLDGSHLIVQDPPQRDLVFVATGDRTFSVSPGGDTKITFEVDAEGRPTKLNFIRSGTNQVATRIP